MTSKSCEPCRRQHPAISKHLGMAAMSSAFAESLTFPIDTIKVYLQLQTKLNTTNVHIPSELEVGSGYQGMKSGYSHHIKKLGVMNLITTTNRIYQKQGFIGFYRGYKPAVLRASLNNALSATIYKPVRKLLGYEHRDCPLHIKLIAGIITGSCTQIIAAPTDLLKVRMQADATRDTPRYRSLSHAIRHIYKQHGILAFWKGLVPSMGRAGFSVAATLGTYDHCKSFVLKHPQSALYGINDKDIRLHVLCSVCSGFFATLLACPFDVIKTRYQAQSFRNPLYESPKHCLSTIVREEGTVVLFKGWLPMYARLVIKLKQLRIIVVNVAPHKNQRKSKNHTKYQKRNWDLQSQSSMLCVALIQPF
eukprot:781892_1